MDLNLKVIIKKVKSMELGRNIINFEIKIKIYLKFFHLKIISVILGVMEVNMLVIGLKIGYLEKELIVKIKNSLNLN
jgi:hypothetical protein